MHSRALEEAEKRVQEAEETEEALKDELSLLENDYYWAAMGFSLAESSLNHAREGEAECSRALEEAADALDRARIREAAAREVRERGESAAKEKNAAALKAEEDLKAAGKTLSEAQNVIARGSLGFFESQGAEEALEGFQNGKTEELPKEEGTVAEALQALMALGYSQAEARGALKDIEDARNKDVQELLQLAFRRLM